jgi:cell division protein FtsQ
VAAALALALVGGGYLWLRDSSLVAVDQVAVTGATGPDAAAIRSALTATARDMTTLHVDVQALRDAVAAYPTVKDVTATTDGMHGLRIQVAEHVPVAVADAGGAQTPIAADGTVLRRGVLRTGLPVISADATTGGPRLDGAKALAALQVAAAAPLALRPFVAQIGPGPAGLVAKLASGPDIVFGSPREGRAKWLAAARVLADPNARGAEYIDVSVPLRPVAGRFDPGRGVASTEAAIPLDSPSGPTADNPTAVPDPAASQP